MIPKYLQDKTVSQIVNQVRYNVFQKEGNEHIVMDDYVMILEDLLRIAVENALYIADDYMKTPLGQDLKRDYYTRGQHAEKRAIVFLNKVLPKE